MSMPSRSITRDPYALHADVLPVAQGKRRLCFDMVIAAGSGSIDRSDPRSRRHRLPPVVDRPVETRVAEPGR